MGSLTRGSFSLTAVLGIKVRKTYVGPTGRCWGSGSWGTAPGVYPGDSALYGCSSPGGGFEGVQRGNESP